MRSIRFLTFLLIILVAPTFAATKLYPHNFGAPVSGGLHASTQQGALKASSVTTTVGSGTSIQATQIAGGTALTWISAPLSAPATINGSETCNIWAKEATTSVNAAVQCTMYKWSNGSIGSALCTATMGAELTTTMAVNTPTCTFTSTAFAVDDRIEVKVFVINIGTMGANTNGVTMDFDGKTTSSDGDSYVSFAENLSFRPEPEVIQAVVSNISSASTGNVTVAATGAGNLLIVGVAGQNQSNFVTSVTDNRAGGSNTYTRITGSHSTVNLATPCASTTGFTDILYAVNSLSGATTITFNLNAVAADAEIWVVEVSNMALSSPVDNSAVAVVNNQVAGSLNLAGPSFTTTNPTDFLFQVTYLTSQATNALNPWAYGPPIANGNAVGYTSAAPGSYQPTTVSNGSTGTDCYAMGSAGFVSLGSYVKHGTVTFSGATGSTQTGISLVFSFSDSSLKTVANGGQIQNLCSRNGYSVPCDFTLTDDTSCNTLTGGYTWGFDGDYSATAGTGHGWVQIPSYTTSGVTPKVCWGNTTVSTYQGGATGAEFDSNTLHVYHYPNGSTASYVDFKGTANGTNTGTTATTGKIDGAAAGSGSGQYVTNGIDAGLANISGMTVSCWCSQSSLALSRRIFGDWGGTENRYILSSDDTIPGSLIFGVSNTVSTQIDHATSAVLSAGTIANVVWTWTGGATGNALYVNSVSQALTNNLNSQPATLGTAPTANEFVFQSGDNQDWNGTIDELEVSTIARSQNWISTQYANQSSPPALIVSGGSVQVFFPVVY